MCMHILIYKSKSVHHNSWLLHFSAKVKVAMPMYGSTINVIVEKQMYEYVIIMIIMMMMMMMKKTG